MMRRGQVALYLLMTIVVLAVVCFMNVDIFLAVRAKNRVQNAGDAAALAAAREQGRLLNEIGRLNIDHILEAVRNAPETDAACRAIEGEQRRLALLGPVEALKKANEAAKANGAEARDDFKKLLQEHVVTIRTVYSGGVDVDGDPYPEPWPGAWAEYASAIEQALADGLAVGPDNNEYYDGRGGHLLLNPDFYDAVAGRCWCWFHFNAENALRHYTGWSSWGPFSPRKTNAEGNCELFSLHVEARTGALADVFSFAEIAEMASKWSAGSVTLADVQGAAELTNAAAVWFYLEPGAWSQWFDGLRLAGDEEDGSGDFPLVGEVKRAYNVRGAAAACRAILPAPGIVEAGETEVVWSAAAKPFGKIADESLGDVPVTAARYFALPVFEAVRLVPLDAIGGGCLGSADLGWVHHIRNHLPDYLSSGLTRSSDCSYCRCLDTWGKAEFHQTGAQWLDQNAKTCVRGSGSSRSYGGTRHGH